jgi:hypothetical protein
MSGLRDKADIADLRSKFPAHADWAAVKYPEATQRVYAAQN